MFFKLSWNCPSWGALNSCIQSQGWESDVLSSLVNNNGNCMNIHDDLWYITFWCSLSSGPIAWQFCKHCFLSLILLNMRNFISLVYYTCMLNNVPRCHNYNANFNILNIVCKWNTSKLYTSSIVIWSNFVSNLYLNFFEN